nr:hypothetical protein Hi04_10k_c3883_00015 [uncultured bacterium]
MRRRTLRSSRRGLLPTHCPIHCQSRADRSPQGHMRRRWRTRGRQAKRSSTGARTHDADQPVRTQAMATGSADLRTWWRDFKLHRLESAADRGAIAVRSSATSLASASDHRSSNTSPHPPLTRGYRPRGASGLVRIATNNHRRRRTPRSAPKLCLGCMNAHRGRCNYDCARTGAPCASTSSVMEKKCLSS